jgi:hypothetical protein
MRIETILLLGRLNPLFKKLYLLWIRSCVFLLGLFEA